MEDDRLSRVDLIVERHARIRASRRSSRARTRARAVSPREVAYRGREDAGGILADLDDAASARTCRDAAESFLVAHLRCFAEPLYRRPEGTLPHLELAARARIERPGPAPERYCDSLLNGPTNSEDGDCPSCDGCPAP